MPRGSRTRSPALACTQTPSSFRSSLPSCTRMNSSWVGWMCTGTNWPGSLLVSNAKVESVTALGKYTCPRMFQVLPEYPVPLCVMPFSSAAMLSTPFVAVTMTLSRAHQLSSACGRHEWASLTLPCKSLKFKISVGNSVRGGRPMSKPLHSQHALVTGGGRGIGRAVAAVLSEAGAVVTVLGRHRATLDEAIASGAAQFAAVADVADAASVKSAIAEAVARQPIDILVANAGAAESAPFGRSDAALFQRMMDVNFMGVVHATQAVLPGMIERRQGRIVAIASTAGLKGYAYVSAYSAAKHAVIGLVRSLALETAKSGVTVNAVCPGFTETDLLEGSIDNIIKKTGRSREQAVAELSKHNPQGRLVAPSEVADAVLWLCGEGAGAITGQAIAVAGGEV